MFYGNTLYILQVNRCSSEYKCSQVNVMSCLVDDRKGGAPPLPVIVLNKVCRIGRQRVDMSDMLTRVVCRPEVDGVTNWRQHARVEAVYQ